MSTTRVNMNLDNELLHRLDAYASRFGVNRTSAVSILLTQSLDTAEVLKSMPDIDYLVKGLSEINSKLDSGELIVETRKVKKSK